MVVDELDALRDTNEGCRTIAFSDLSTQMILVTDSGSNLRREALDALCAEAIVTLGMGDKPTLGTQVGTAAIVANKGATRIFVRGAAEPNDVLCCVCTPEVDVVAFLADARSCLDRITSG
jgi:hypothetical protein